MQGAVVGADSKEGGGGTGVMMGVGALIFAAEGDVRGIVMLMGAIWESGEAGRELDEESSVIWRKGGLGEEVMRMVGAGVMVEWVSEMLESIGLRMDSSTV